MDRTSVRDWTFLSPYAGPTTWSWDGRVATLSLADTLRPATYTLLIGTSVTDRKGNHMLAPASVQFSTDTTLARGRIGGIVAGRRAQVGGAFVLLSRTRPIERRSAAVQDLAEYLTITDASGRFTAGGLPQGEFHVAVLVDRNGNRAYDPDRDLLSNYCDPVVLAPAGDSVADLRVAVGDPDEHPSLAGTIVDSSRTQPAARDSAQADSIQREITARLRVTVSGESTFTVNADSVRAFVIPSLPAGRYTLRAFLDQNGDGVLNAGDPMQRRMPDPQSEPVTLCLSYGDDRRDLRLIVRPPGMRR
jgi:uncharacterized protein (DUF2141 family)